MFRLLLVLVVIGGVQSLTPTKIISTHIYTLMSQHDGRYLSDGGNGIPTKTQGNPQSPNQQFKFTQAEGGGDIWSVVSVGSSVPLGGTKWRVSYVGHGKYQLQNTGTGLCLQGEKTEAVCGNLIPTQRWFLESQTKP